MARIKEKKEMSYQEKLDWDELYEYVKKILNYDNNQALSKTMCLRLKGLLSNRFMENYNVESTSNYSYKVVLNTFKYCSNDIKRAFKNNSFKDEKHKFNYMLRIVQENINDVYIRMKNIEKAKEEAKNTTVEVVSYDNAEYKPKEKKKDKFSDLW